MKAKVLLLFISFACASAAYSFGQIDCATSKKLVCEFPVSATTLAANTIGNASGSFGTVFGLAETATRPFDASIATQLTQLPIPSATIGVVSLRNKGSDVPVPFDNLGPILTDRPDTVGKQHLFLGFSYQHFNFNSLDGQHLGSLPAGFTFSQISPSNSNDTQTFYGAESNNVSFKLDQYVWVLTYGITKTTDLSVVVPINSVNLGVISSNFQAAVFDSAAKQYTNLSPAATTQVVASGSASGAGDVTVNFKRLLVGADGGRPAIAIGATLRFPTGDALNYLGSGALGGSAYGLFESRRPLAPHLKVSYQWNSNSQVLDLQQPKYLRLPGGLQYAAGFDYKLIRQVTVAADFLGSQFINTPSFALSTAPLNPAPTGSNGGNGINQNFTTVTGLNNTYTTANFSAGLKWAPIRHVLVYGNMLKQLNNVGLRSNIVPLVGIAFKR